MVQQINCKLATHLHVQAEESRGLPCGVTEAIEFQICTIGDCFLCGTVPF